MSDSRRYGHLFDTSPTGHDLLGRYVRVCAKSRQIICRDPQCVGRGRCKSFPQELLALADKPQRNLR